MSYKIERVLENTELGEGPHWDASRQRLYFVDIFGKTINCYHPETGKHTNVSVGRHVGFVVPVEGKSDQFVAGVGRDLVIVTWDGISKTPNQIEKLYEIDVAPDTLGNRFNDGKCDPSGRLWAGSMGAEPINGQITPEKGAFYSFGPEGMKKHISNVWCSNGLAWNATGDKLYYIDTFKKSVDQFDFDIKTGTIANRTPIFTPEKHNVEGALDGMTIDTDGMLWIAMFNGYQVIKIDPHKPETLLEQIKLPAKQVTSVTFGGKALDELYVTSAAFTVDGVELPPPHHGAVYRILGTGSKGYPGVNFKLCK